MPGLEVEVESLDRGAVACILEVQRVGALQHGEASCKLTWPGGRSFIGQIILAAALPGGRADLAS